MQILDRLRGRFLLSSIALVSAAANLSGAVIESVEIRGTRARLALETKPGETLSPSTVRRDVRRLWKTGHFDDIRVESSTEDDNVHVVFRVAERPRFMLREIRFDPPGERRDLGIRTGDPVTQAQARETAWSLTKQLASDGFPEARVEANLKLAGGAHADLEIHVARGPKVSFDRSEIRGSLGLDAGRLRKAMKATAPQRWLPGIPGIWNGWVSRAPYNPENMEADLAAVRSHYFAEGFLAATVGLEGVRVEQNTARAGIRVAAGPRYQIAHASIETPRGSRSLRAAPRAMLPKLCECLLEERRNAGQEGRLDFSVQLEWEAVEGPAVSAAARPRENHWARLVARVEPGPQYRVGRIEFRGNSKLRDSTLRRALTIQEGDWLDPHEIRRSLERLSRIEMIEPIEEAGIRTQPGPGNTVDLVFPVRERKHGRWSVSGPLGPASWFGPLRLSLDSRLPPWGRSVLDLSTWLATFGVVSYTDPVLAIVAGDAMTLWRPFVALRRPLLPGQGWTSGFLLSPSLAIKEHLAHTAMLHARSGVDRGLEPSGNILPPLAVVVSRHESDGATLSNPGILLCKPPKSRTGRLRSAASLLLRFALGG